MTRLRYALAAVVLLLTAACGDDSGSATTTTTEATTTTTAEATTTTIREAELGLEMQNLAEEMCRRFDENGTSDIVADGVYSATQAAVDTYPASQRELAKSQFFVFFIKQCDYAVPYGQAQQRAK